MKKKWQFQYRDLVRYVDCDMHGHMNHARYLGFFEHARVEFFRKLGFRGKNPFEQMPFILAHIRCDYKAPAYVGDRLTSRVRIGEFGNSSLTLEHELLRTSDKKILAKSISVLVYFDYKKQKSKQIPEAIRRKFVT